MTFRKAKDSVLALAGNGALESDQLGGLIGSEAKTNSARLQHLVGRLHALGPRPLHEFLMELLAGADLLTRLEVYAALPVEVVRGLGGDVLPVDRLIIIEGGAA